MHADAMASEAELLAEARSDAAPAMRAISDPTPPWEQRILQLAGKRYSLRLEHEFWAALETIAGRRKLRLNRLVADIAERRPADANLSSILRVFCLGEVERAGSGRTYALDGGGIAAVVEAAPAAGVVLDGEQTILAVNEAFLHWSGIRRAVLLREKLARHFRLQAAGDRGGPGVKPRREENTRIVGIMPGRVLSAEASLVPAPGTRGRRLSVLWVKA